MNKSNNEIAIEYLSQIDSKIQSLNIKGIGLNNKQDEELYLTLKILKTKINQLNITLPFNILISDKPDIRIQTENINIGIEITFALNETLQKAKRIRDKLDPSLILEPSLYKNNKGRDYILKTLKKSNNRLIGSAYSNDELEYEVVEIILRAIEKKLKKYNSYSKFDKNYLFLYSDVLLADEHKIINLIIEKISYLNHENFDRIILRLQGKNYKLK